MKLLADSMLGSLGRWLRLLGYDTTIAHHYEPDSALVHQARAEGRILLTRDRILAQRKGVATLLVWDGSLDAQLRQVFRDLDLPAPQPGTRCPVCNVPLSSATHAEVAREVPPYVLQTQPAFKRCPSCRRIYWQGTHWEGVEQAARDLATHLRPAAKS